MAAVEVDFASLLKASGRSGDFESSTVEISDSAGDFLPLKVKAGDGIWRVLWRVPAAPTKGEAGTEGSFKLGFGGERGRSPVLESGENLVYNGDFGILGSSGAPEPFDPATFAGNFDLLRTEDGGRAISFKSSEASGVSYRTPWIRVGGADKLKYELVYRCVDAKAHHFNLVYYSYAYFRDSEGELIPRKSLFSSRESNSDGWRTLSYTLSIPEGAAATYLEFRAASGVPGSVSLKEVRILPASAEEVTEARLEGGGVVSLTARGENIHRFDLGPDNSPVMAGYTALTPKVEYTAERGYGFTRVARPHVRDKLRPDDLGRDYVAAADVRFRLDLPDGDYRVWALTGDSQADNVVMSFFFDQELKINGRSVYTDTTSPGEVFKSWGAKNYDKFWLPGMDYYETFMAPRFRGLTFDVTVDKGRLDLNWRNMPVCALIIYPVADSDAVAGELSWLAGRRRRQGRLSVEPGPVEAPVAATGKERGRGFMLFRRSADELIFPSSRPQDDERVAELSTFGVPGQLVSANFSLYPMRDLGGLRIRMTDLRGPGGGISAVHSEVRVVRYLLRRLPGDKYRVEPRFLDRRDVVPVTDGTTWSWYVQVRVPEDCAAGVYKGSVEILPESGGSALGRLPLQVRVLPFRLEPLPIAQGYYYTPGEPWYATFWGANVVGARDLRKDPEVLEIIKRNEIRELRFMKSLGLNSASFGDDLRGDMRLEGGEATLAEDDRFSLWMDIYSAEGMGPMPFYGFQSIGSAHGNKIAWIERGNEPLQVQYSPEWNRAYQGLVRNIMKRGAERGWPEILWYLSDELSNYREEGALHGVKLGKILREVPGATTIASMNGPWEHIMTPYVDISMPNIAFPITGETVEKIERDGSRLWLYNCGNQRLTLGLYPWRVKAGGRFQWHYRSQAGEDWDDGAGMGKSKYAISFLGRDEVVPALDAQTVREAIYDHRYIATLEKVLSDAEAASAKSAKMAESIRNAREFIDYLTSRVPVDAREVIGFNIDPRAAGAAIGGEFRNTDNLDRVRWSMAQLIMDLGGEGM